MNALSRLCLARAGFDPARLSPDELRDRLPDVIEALLGEAADTAGTLAIVQKSAVDRLGSAIPNPGIVRDERITAAESPADPNGVFDSLIPFARE
jgi:hypothetical protein